MLPNRNVLPGRSAWGPRPASSNLLSDIPADSPTPTGPLRRIREPGEHYDVPVLTSRRPPVASSGGPADGGRLRPPLMLRSMWLPRRGVRGARQVLTVRSTGLESGLAGRAVGTASTGGASRRRSGVGGRGAAACGVLRRGDAVALQALHQRGAIGARATGGGRGCGCRGGSGAACRAAARCEGEARGDRSNRRHQPERAPRDFAVGGHVGPLRGFLITRPRGSWWRSSR
jgi:hypothetical protein